jgi:hypothetical protein
VEISAFYVSILVHRKKNKKKKAAAGESLARGTVVRRIASHRLSIVENVVGRHAGAPIPKRFARYFALAQSPAFVK